jgi:hypothetical protein
VACIPQDLSHRLEDVTVVLDEQDESATGHGGDMLPRMRLPTRHRNDEPEPNAGRGSGRN